MELIWEGKYDANHRKVAPLKIALPFQTVETINESAADRDRSLDLFAEGGEPEWRNRLIWGDKKYVLPSLLPEFAGKVSLIYIDPPFDTGADFSFTTTIPDSDETFVKEPSVIEQKAYRDTWGKGLDSYLKWFYETIVLLRDLLTEDGSIYVHLDWRMVHYAKAVMDEVFGAECFLNEIVWAYFAFKRSSAKKFPQKHDIIVSYHKTENYIWHTQYKPHKEDYLKRWKIDEQGRYYRDDVNPTRGGTRIIYLDEVEGDIVDSVWDDIPPVNPVAIERQNYPTQKPEALLERILKASSNEGDLVLDCFCGSGTTAAVTEKLGRRWITCDLGRFAIHTTRKRLLGIEGVRPFVVQNLGKYERQQWQQAEFGERAAALQHAYRDFVLDLYHARPLSGYVWLHGVKDGRRVHVGSVDSAVSLGDITQIVLELRKAVGTGSDAPTGNGVDVLGWDFAFELNETARQQAALAGIDLRLKRIPREVLEKKAVEQGDIRFFELAALAVETAQNKRSVTLRLTDFCIPPDDVPDEIQRAITHWEQWIDYWAVDWDYRGDTFHNQWQSYRTRKNRTLQKQSAHPYAEPGDYRIVVKVIDILGNDTTKVLSVTLG